MWQPIETAPKEGCRMFVVRAFGVTFSDGSFPYTSDPYCVWRSDDGGFERWPHRFSPTHWMPLPDLPGTQPAPSISPVALRHVIQWLRNGCDPMKAADELEMLAAAPEAKP